MTTLTIPTIDAKEEFTEIINRVAHHKERIVLTRRGKEIAAIIPLEDLFLLQSAENQHDLNQAMEALKEARAKGTFSLNDLQKEMG